MCALSPRNSELEDAQLDLNPQESTEMILAEYQDRIYRKTDQLFAWLFLLQWAIEIIFSVLVTPRTWIGTTSLVHIHVWAALFLGLAIIIPPLYLIRTRPGKPETRQTVAIAQGLTGIFLIHLTGGRIETHFHVFGSLAFLAIYRDWRVLATMTVIVALDHLARGYFWPQSVYGIIEGSGWRWLEHAAWVLFEDIFLFQSCYMSQAEMRSSAEKQAQLAELNKSLDQQVLQRTEQLTRLQSELIQSDKLASLGQLAAGVAHEINNPIGFVMSNLATMSKYAATLKNILAEYRHLADECQNNGYQQTVGHIREIEKQSKLTFILEDIDNLLMETKDGTGRVKDIVQNLKSFARLDEAEIKECDINVGIQDTLKIAWNELKYKCKVNVDFGNIPKIQCNPGQLNQVFLNLLINAAHAIPEQGEISLHTSASDSHVIIQVADTGSGIPPENLNRIFDPFFTTKPVGQGTGLGLSISYGIIQRHQGTIEVESELGKGTTFTIKLPLHSAPKA